MRRWAYASDAFSHLLHNLMLEFCQFFSHCQIPSLTRQRSCSWSAVLAFGISLCCLSPNTGMRNLFTITGHTNCVMSLEGRKIYILSWNSTFIVERKKKYVKQERLLLTYCLRVSLTWSFVSGGHSARLIIRKLFFNKWFTVTVGPTHICVS